MKTLERMNSGGHQEVALELNRLGVDEIASNLRVLLADVFALYLKSKNFHWHMTGTHFRDYHLLLDEHADQIFAMIDPIAERGRKIGGTTLRSIADIARHQQLSDNDAPFVSATDMLEELSRDNLQLAHALRFTHNLCGRFGDLATASMVETWIDETERRVWFLKQTLSA
jgi:starvation-inducible DNA-binding protein